MNMAKIFDRFSKLAAFLATAAVLTLGACGGPEPTAQPTPDLAAFLVQDLAQPVFQCVSSCSTHSQCQDSCPAPSSGTSCCDTSTNTCFTSQAAQCPAPQDLSMPNPY
jgi:hypothetical protein